jgi:hypothetical protein
MQNAKTTIRLLNLPLLLHKDKNLRILNSAQQTYPTNPKRARARAHTRTGEWFQIPGNPRAGIEGQ